MPFEKEKRYGTGSFHFGITLVKIPVPYQCPFCIETVSNGHFSSPAVPDQYLWVPGGNSIEFPINARFPKQYPAQLGRTAVLPRNRWGTLVISTQLELQFRNCTLQKEGIAVLPRNRLGTPVASTRATAAAPNKQLRNGDLSWPVPPFTRQEAAIRNASLRLMGARLFGFYQTEKLGLIF